MTAVERGPNELRLILFMNARGFFRQSEIDALRILAQNGIDRETAAAVFHDALQMGGSVISNVRSYIELHRIKQAKERAQARTQHEGMPSPRFTTTDYRSQAYRWMSGIINDPNVRTQIFRGFDVT